MRADGRRRLAPLGHLPASAGRGGGGQAGRRHAVHKTAGTTTLLPPATDILSRARPRSTHLVPLARRPARRDVCDNPVHPFLSAGSTMQTITWGRERSSSRAFGSLWGMGGRLGEGGNVGRTLKHTSLSAAVALPSWRTFLMGLAGSAGWRRARARAAAGRVSRRGGNPRRP